MVAREPLDLRPMDYAGILDRAFELYRNNFLLLVCIAGFVYAPIALLTVVMASSAHTPAAGAAVGGSVALLTLPLMLCAHAAITYAISAVYLGQHITWGQAYRAIVPRLWPLFGTLILCGALVMGGMLLFIIPGLIFCFWITFVTQVVVLEGLSGSAAISRSKYLVSGGEWVRIFILGILVGLLTMFIGGAGTAAATALNFAGPGGQTASSLVQFAMNTVIQPFNMLAFTLLYYDIRIRKEAFDLQMLAGHLAVPTYQPAQPQPVYGTPTIYPHQQQAPYPPQAPPPPSPAPAHSSPGQEGVFHLAPHTPPPQSAATDRCAQCNNALPAGVKFCGICGHAVPAAAPRPTTCSQCGAAMADDARFCSECGASRPS